MPLRVVRTADRRRPGRGLVDGLGAPGADAAGRQPAGGRRLAEARDRCSRPGRSRSAARWRRCRALPTGDHVIAASAGNHGLAVAWAASLFGLQATVVVSEQASPAKIAKLRAQPIELILHGDPDAAEALRSDPRRPGSTLRLALQRHHRHRRSGTVGGELESQTLGPADDRRAGRRWRPAGGHRALGAASAVT